MNSATQIKTSSDKRPMVLRNGNMRAKLRDSLINTNAIWVNTSRLKPASGEFNCVDLFSGAGGISCGFSMAGLKSILGVEIDPDAAETYKNNFGEAYTHCGDIKELSNQSFKEIVGDKTPHIVTGGFPCQGFSIAGYRDPNDKRNTLYKEVVRVVKTLKPWYVVLENVPGIISMKKGEVYQTVIRDFNDIGYPHMSVQVLESADYGVAQLRPRAIFIANRFGLQNPYPRPLLSPEEYVPIESAIDDLKHKPRDPSTNHEWTMHSKKMEARIAKVNLA